MLEWTRVVFSDTERRDQIPISFVSCQSEAQTNAKANGEKEDQGYRPKTNRAPPASAIGWTERLVLSQIAKLLTPWTGNIVVSAYWW